MRPFVRCLVLCLASLPILPALAQPLEGLYQVREPIRADQDEAREEQLRRAFDTLVLRLTGDPQAVSSDALKALRDEPRELVRQFGTRGEALLVEFDAASVQRVLREAGLGIWGPDRPVLLTWWLNEDDVGTQLIGDGQRQAETLRTAAQYRGLPLRLPLADLTEQLSITPEAIREGSDELESHAARYDADALLAVHAQGGDEQWRAAWQLWLGDRQQQGEVSADSREALADEVMREAHAFIAPLFVSAPGQAEPILLEIEGADISRFAELNRLLQPLGGQLHQMEADRLIYRLEADPEQLRSQLALARLYEVPVEADPVDATQPLDEADQALDGAEESVAETPSVPEQSVMRLRYRW
ncbi:DUF2066 domain-containing protein [Stutzerimonas tarimensis]|uniref:DUF2066 domain-containing protein n=1 Tax=Stutzerimonas tarimensis TaxID=1507735 RepID=A0ABV7T9S2_9GAMM